MAMPTSTANKSDSPSIDSTDAARLSVDVALDKDASDLMMIDIRKVATFADFMVIMSADSPRQIDALAEDQVKSMKQKGDRKLYHREGTPDSGWVLLDFSDVIVHIFSEPQRAYYRLEQVWKEGRLLVKMD